ncbi:MAG: IS1182 family transposase [Acidobacteria bacterium]|nr:IS1182 family transposase [Acidobacteriota bacterium]
MMGRMPAGQESLFVAGFSLDKRIRQDHPLRKIAGVVDFKFVDGEVRDKYGYNGNVSVPPVVVLKMMLLLVAYNVRSERELMETIPERLDWLWFLGYNLESDVPGHSVLSKARIRWGEDVFKKFFERVLMQCVERGLVDGSKIFMDSSLVYADASKNSVVDTETNKKYLDKGYPELEKRLGEREVGDGKVNRRHVSSTDPEAAIIRRGGSPNLAYKVHRSVDSSSEVITATQTTAADTDDAHKMAALMEDHKRNTGLAAKVVVADSKYGTVENFLSCYDMKVKAHVYGLRRAQEKGGGLDGIYSESRFKYDESSDSYECPAGKRLRPKSRHLQRQSVDYAASKKDCAACDQRSACTKNKDGRTVKRHLRHRELSLMRSRAGSKKAKADLKTRSHLMERSFARSVRYGFKRARWRGRWRVAIQEYMTSTIQNIFVLTRN